MIYLVRQQQSVRMMRLFGDQLHEYLFTWTQHGPLCKLVLPLRKNLKCLLFETITDIFPYAAICWRT